MPTPLSLNWSSQGANGTDISGGFTQNTGGINVGVTYIDDGLGTQFDVSSDTQYVGSGEPMSSSSSVELRGNAGTGDTSTTRIDFSAASGSDMSSEVENVIFRINDADISSWTDLLTVRAYDANGNQISVSMTYQGSTVSGTDPSVTGTGTNYQSNSAQGSILVEIAGPVAYFEIDYGNDGTGAQALWVTDVHFDAIDLDGTVEGSAGNDVIDDTYILDPDGDKVDSGDEILPGYGADGDLIEAYGGNDTVLAGAGDDSVYAGTGNDSVSGGDGDDTVFLEDGDDEFGDWSTDDGNDTIYGGAGNDQINAGNGADTLYGGTGDDTLIGASGDDDIFGGTGSDQIQITDDHESDVIEGGEDGDGSDVDEVNFSNYESALGVTVTATGDEAGTYDFDGTVGDGSYIEIEAFDGTDYDDTFNLAADDSGTNVDADSGDDVIITGDGDDVVDGGQGADTFNTGAGDDQINLGEDSPGVADGDPDVVILEDGFGNDIVTNFDAPTPDGFGMFTGIDTLDVSNLYDLPLGDPDRTSVMTNDVVVTDDGSGNALLTFPNGETLTLVGIDPTDADNPFYLHAIGIPMPDGTVEGTAGNDTIDATYTGDPDGDMVDADDAILSGDTGDDDLIYGYGGDDSITAGAGDDEVYGGAGNDAINSGTGDDTVYGGTGNDTVTVDSANGTDVLEGGEDAGNADVDTLDFTDASGPDGVDVTMSGDEAGSYSYPTDGGNGTFSEFEELVLTDQDDAFDGLLATGGNTVDGGAGEDVLVGSNGDDSFEGGSGDDVLNANQGNDALSGGAGNDTVYGDEGDDVITGGADNDALYGGDDNDTIDGGTGDDTVEGGSGDDTLAGGDGADTIIGGADQDVIYGGAGDVIDGSGSGVDYDTLIVSNVDYIDYDTDPENGTVYFDGGGSLTFTDIENVVVSDRDGTVSGTAGDDTIDSFYLGDPDGDQVDDTDAILVGHEPNDDLIEAGAGNDTIYSGAGVDTVYGGTGNDTIASGAGNDTNFGEAGNDLIVGQGGDDTSFGGTGDDILNGGVGDDALFGGDGADQFVQEAGFGSDVIEGGEGGTDNDEIRSTQNIDITVTATGDEAGSITDGTSTATFTEIEAIETEGGDDTINLGADSAGMTVDAGAGNDTITGGSGDDLLLSGSGDDLVSTGAGNDTVLLGTGDDEVSLGAGNDTAYGGTGRDIFQVSDASGTNTVAGGEGLDGSGDILNANDPADVTVTTSGDEAGTLTTGSTTVSFSEIEVIQTDAGNDTVDLSNDSVGMTAFSYAGDDTVTGGSGDDSILAGAGDDVLDGNEGADTIDAGTGDDTVTFSEGDTVDGGAGDDLFVLEDLGETSNGTITIDGGAGDETPDPDGDGPLTGGDTLQIGNLGILTQAVRDTFVNDGTGSYTGSITLDDGTILNFTEIENIICFTPGTRIATPQGLVAIEDLEVGDMVVTRDHGLQPIRWIEGRTVPAVDRFAPVRIGANVLCGQERELLVSPQHRVLFQGYRAELLFGESEVLVSAKHLVDGMDVTQDETHLVTYVHMLFDHHEIIFAEGAATESFHPGDIGFSAVGDSAREELFAIFPELRSDVRAYGDTARRCLKEHEAKLIRT